MITDAAVDGSMSVSVRGVSTIRIAGATGGGGCFTARKSKNRPNCGPSRRKYMPPITHEAARNEIQKRITAFLPLVFNIFPPGPEGVSNRYAV
jgi:hypothetical protein